MFHSCEKSILRKNPDQFFPLRNFRLLYHFIVDVVLRNAMMLQHLIVQFPLFYLSSGLQEHKNKINQNFNSKSGGSRLQEVVVFKRFQILINSDLAAGNF